MKKLVFTACALLILFVGYSFFIRAGDVDNVHIVQPVVVEENGSFTYFFLFQRIETGKNLLVFPFEPGLDARTFLEKVKDADAVTSLNDGQGYIRAFGGLGKNFQFHAHKNYEVSVIRSVNFTITAGGR